MINYIKKPWKQLGFKSETEYIEHLAVQERIAKERGFVPYNKYQKHDKLNKLLQELEESAESCNTQLPYNIPVSIRHLNREIIEGHIDKSTYDTMLERIRLSTDKFEKKCNCSGTTKAPIRDIHQEETMNRIQLFKESVESCRSNAPSMSFMATRSLGVYDGYSFKGPYRMTEGLMEILNIAVEFKGCSCR